MKYETVVKLMIFFWALYLALFLTGVYVAAHFIIKFW